MKAQSADGTGELSGVVRDSSGTPLPLATVAVYKKPDTALIAYQLATASGSFLIKNIPENLECYLIISYTGYDTYRDSFSINSKNHQLVFPPVLMSKRDEIMEEVIVKAERPPMQMKGDTLEFNADAFIVKENGVVEDLLRKLPGVIVWGDGKITVNGKTVSQVYVEGKPFFTGDMRIATQNLPKGIVDKIQVYASGKERDSLLERGKGSGSGVDMNIVLKKGKKDGIFGKTALGYGPDNRYEGDLMLGKFSPKVQLGVVGAVNNTNKEAFNANGMMNNNTFKQGGGDWTAYRSNFGKPGYIDFLAGGLNYSQDLSKKTKAHAEYFGYDINTNRGSNEKTVTNISNNQQQITANQHQENNYNRVQNFTGNLVNRKSPENVINLTQSKNNLYKINPEVFLQKQINESKDSSFTTNSEGQLLNKYNSQNNTIYNVNSIGFTTEFDHLPNVNKRKWWRGNFKYRFKTEARNNDNQYKSNFQSFSDGQLSDSMDYNRQTTNKTNRTLHELDFPVSGFFGLFMKYNIPVTITNHVAYSVENNVTDVSDFDEVDIKYSKRNNYLSSNQQYTLFTEKPSISYSYYKQDRLEGRFSKNFSFNAGLTGSFISSKNKSTSQFLHFNRGYSDILPNASFNYYNYQAGRFTREFTIRYSTDINLPNRNQLVSLIDSSRQTSVWLGNSDLKKSYNHDIRLEISQIRPKGDQSNSIRLIIESGKTNNRIINGAFYDSLGRYVNQPLNVNGYRFARATVNYMNGIKFNGQNFNFVVAPGVNISRNPAFINNQRVVFDYQSFSWYASVAYSKNDLWEGEFRYSGNINNNIPRQSGFTKTSQFNQGFTGHFQLFWPGKFTLDNNFTYAVFGGKSLKKINSLIWNSEITYRFLKNGRAEIKATMNDLLGQTREYYSSVSRNSITQGTQNRLMQYFLIKLVYYPREFGLKKQN